METLSSYLYTCKYSSCALINLSVPFVQLDKSKKIIPTDKIPKLKKKPVTPEKKAVKDVASSVAGKKTKTQSIKSEKTNHKKRNKVRSQSLSPAKGKVNKRSKVPPLNTEEKSKTRAKKSSAKVRCHF